MRKEIASEKEMMDFGSFLGERALSFKEPFLLALEGNLGSGKTTLLKGFARGLGIEEEITSPTFLIYKNYPLRGGRSFYHFDVYRVNEEDVLSLGFREIVSQGGNIVAVEWSDRIKNILPEKRMDILFKLLSPERRELIIKDKSGIVSN